MLRLHNIKLPLSYSGQSLAPERPRKSARRLPSAVAHCEISRKSVDARKKNDVCFVVALDVTPQKSADESGLPRGSPAVGGLAVPCAARPWRRSTPFARSSPVSARRSVRRADAKAGACPIVLERGQDVDTRTRDVHAYGRAVRRRFPFFQRAVRRGRRRHVFRWKAQHRHEGSARRHILRTFVASARPHDILIDANRTSARDKLCGVVKAMRMRFSVGRRSAFPARA